MARTCADSRKDDSMSAINDLLKIIHDESFSQEIFDMGEQAAAELAAMQEWKGEVIEACIVDWIEPTTPKETIARLISENVKQALDPAISEPVAKLHDRIKELETAMLSIEFDETTGECLLGCGGDSVGGHMDDCIWWKNDTFRGVSNNRLDNS